MRKSEVHVGETYVAKVSGNLTTVLITGEHRLGGWTARNTKTNYPVRIRTGARLRRKAESELHRGQPVSPQEVVPTINEGNRLLANRPWELWTGKRVQNPQSGETYIATSDVEWMPRLDIWRTVVRRFVDVANCPCPSPMPEGHVMFE